MTAVPSYYRFGDLAHELGDNKDHWQELVGTGRRIPEVTRDELEATFAHVANHILDIQNRFAVQFGKYTPMKELGLTDLLSLFASEEVEKFIPPGFPTGQQFIMDHTNIFRLDYSGATIEKEQGWDFYWQFNYFNKPQQHHWLQSMVSPKLFFQAKVAKYDAQHEDFVADFNATTTITKAGETWNQTGEFKQRDILYAYMKTQVVKGDNGGYLVFAPGGPFVVPIFTLDKYIEKEDIDTEATALNRSVSKTFFTAEYHIAHIFDPEFWTKPS